MGNACMGSSSVEPTKEKSKEKVQVKPQAAGPVKKEPHKKAARSTKNQAFVSIGSKHRPVNFAGAATNDDTLTILNSLTKSKMAQIISKLYEPGESFSIQGLDDATLKDLSEDYASLCEYALDGMCSAQDFTTRVKWQTCLLHLIQATYQSQFGDLSFFKVKKKADVLRAKYPIGSGEIDPNLKGLDGIEIPAGNKNAKLWDYLEFLKGPKYAQTRKDLEFIARNGKVATPSEIGAVADICNYVQTLKTKFADDMKSTFKNCQEFKSNTKGLARAVFKMDEYAAKKERPSFNYIWDLLRCKAVYADIEDLRKDFVTLTSNYKVIQIKDKLKTALKNITINVVYDKVITEIQLVYGEVAGEYSNHKIYEVYRCESIQEAHKTILAWGDYNFESFKPLCGALLPTRNLEPQVCKGIHGRALHPVMKSKEYGVYTREPVFLSEDSENCACVYPVHLLHAHYDEKNVYAISLQGTPQFLNGTQILSKTIEYNKFIQNATGVYDVKSGIKKLELQMMTGEVIVIGDKSAGSGPEEVSFDFQIPKHCVILGFGYQFSEKSGIKSMYCWFGPVPDLDIEVEKYVLTAEVSIGLPIKCHECTRQLTWCQSFPPDQTDSLPCSGCKKEIPPRAGFASCSKDFSSWCAACIIQQKNDLSVLPTPVKLTCPAKGHKVKWEWGNHGGPDFTCEVCSTTFESNCGRYTCPCGVNFCSNCEGDAKGAPNESQALAGFPVISTDFPCGECNKPLQWYWHTNFFGYENEPFTCDTCEETHPASSGAFHCDKCEYDVCSKCYCDSGKSDITTMPNFRNAKCPNGYYLTWQFSLPKKWTCTTCEEEFSGGSGCYTCPKQGKKCCDFRECAGCYLLKFSNYDNYDEVAIPHASDEWIEEITPYGKYHAGMDCYECGRDLLFLWHKNWAASDEDEEGLYYVCDYHRGRVHCTAGVYYCLKCDYDVCTACYKKEKKTDLTVIPNISNKTCKKDVELVWSYDLPKEWTCTTCDNMYTDYQAGYACECCGKGGYTCAYCVAKANEGETAKEQSTCGNCNKKLKWYWNTHDIGKDYAKENTSCNLCEREIPHNAGIYNCSSCEYDVCSGCQVHQKNAKFKINKFCEGKRPLVWVPGSDCEQQCNVCQEMLPENLAVFKCGDVNCVCRGYSICATCSRKYK